VHRLISVAVALALGVPGALAQDASSIIVFGVVRNASGVPVKGAEVWLDGMNRRVVSNDSGEFRIDGAPAGRVKVMVRRVGFQPDSKKLSLAPGDTRQVQFALEGMLEELDAVIVTAREGSRGRMQEFWARRMVGVGVFITREEIERRHPPHTADLFHMVMGVRVIPSGNGESTRIMAGRQAVSAMRGNSSAASGACMMQYYVDGIFMAPGSFSVDDLPPMMIEGIEVFRGPSEIPARFRQRETGCGLVVLWTREPPAHSKPDSSRLRG
jgi:hypothetical protein